MQLPNISNGTEYQIISRKTLNHLRTVLKKLSLSSIHKSTPQVIIPTPPQDQVIPKIQSVPSNSTLIPHQEGIGESDNISKRNEHVLVWSTDKAYVGHV